MDLEVRGWEDVDCKHVAQNRAKLQARVNKIQGYQLPQTARNFLTTVKIVFSQECLCPVQLVNRDDDTYCTGSSNSKLHCSHWYTCLLRRSRESVQFCHRAYTAKWHDALD
jgi:hypothetical protein